MGLLSETRTARRESHLLKLVHPGGFVELHANPTMASEVMKKNPRHCVTRPDIFRFPWIVVSPESILTPGNVFFIVPCHTIRHLLNQFTHTNTNTNTTTLIKHHRRRFLRKHANESFVDQDRHRHSHSNKIKCFRKQSFVSMSTSCLKLTTTREGGHKQRNGGNKAQSFVTERPVYHSTEYTSRDDAGNPTPNRLGHSEQIPKLKSCLKKDKSHDARSSNLKVRFACADEDLNTSKVCDSQSVEYGH